MATDAPKEPLKPPVGNPEKSFIQGLMGAIAGALKSGEEPYAAKLEALQDKWDRDNEAVHLDSSLTHQEKQARYRDIQAYFENDLEALQKSKPKKKRKRKVAKAKAKPKTPEELLLERQTDQNYIMSNMLAFSDLKHKPHPSELKNLILATSYHGNLINKLTSSSKLEPLMRATPWELSQLTPYFRILKKVEKGGKVTLEEFEFRDHLEWTYKLKGDESARILNSSLGQGVGFKQFNWETTGTNMFSAPRVLMASLNLHFQSISELARSAKMGDVDGVRWVELIVPPTGGRTSIPRGCPTGIPSVDEVLQTNLTPEEITKWSNDPQSRTKREKGFALVVEVGWKYGINNTLRADLRKAVDASRVVLNLTLVSHEFKFREEGTIDLDIKYTARLEGIMNDYSSNIFNLSADGKNNDIFKELEEKKAEIQVMESSIESPTGIFNCIEDPSLTKSQTKKLDKKAEQLIEKIDNLETQAELLTKQLKVSIYGKFTEFLMLNGGLMYVDVPNALYAQSRLPDSFNAADDSAGSSGTVCRASYSQFQSGGLADPKLLTKKRKAYLKRKGKYMPPQSGGGLLGELSSPSDDTMEYLRGNTRGENYEKDEKEVNSEFLKKRITAALGASKALHRDEKRVAFFYLGTLINFFAGALPQQDDSRNKTEKFEIVLGDLTFLDYDKVGQLMQRGFENLDDLNLTDEQRVNVQDNRDAFLNEQKEYVVSNSNLFMVNKNMAFVPISFEAFTTWFTDEIVNGDTIFTFKSFVQSLTTKLIVGALQTAENSFVKQDLKRVLKERTQVKAGVVSGQNKFLKRGKFNREIPPNDEKESSFFVKAAPVNLASPLSPNEMEDNRQFFVLYVTRLPFASQEVNEKKNALDGVYHLYIGADKGIVKTINLQRESNQRIRDANIMRAYNEGGSGLGVIQEPYNANVKLFGSGFFQPGQYVYINPTNIGLGTSLERYSIARKLGIGGFYLITKVSTTIKEGMLETNLKCIFQNYGYLPGDESGTNAYDPQYLYLENPTTVGETISGEPLIGSSDVAFG